MANSPVMMAFVSTLNEMFLPCPSNLNILIICILTIVISLDRLCGPRAPGPQIHCWICAGNSCLDFGGHEYHYLNTQF